MKAFKRHVELGYVGLATGLSSILIPGDIPFEEWDSWHTLIVNDELYRVVRCTYEAILKTETDADRAILEYYGALEVGTVSVFRPS